MPQEATLGQLLAERRWPVAALALVADIDVSTATRIANGQCRPRGTTAIRMAEGLGIGYERMRRILAATWEAGQAAQTGKTHEAAPTAPRYNSHPPVATTGPPESAAGQDSSLRSATR